MIAVLKKDGRYVPAVVCDQCGAVISDALNAVAVSSSAPEGAAADVFHVHKGACDEALLRRLEGLHGSEELSVHLLELVRNTLHDSDREAVANLLKWLGDPE